MRICLVCSERFEASGVAGACVHCGLEHACNACMAQWRRKNDGRSKSCVVCRFDVDEGKHAYAEWARTLAYVQCAFCIVAASVFSCRRQLAITL